MTTEHVKGVVADSAHLTEDQLAVKYAVSVKTVQRILSGESWSNITGLARTTRPRAPIDRIYPEYVHDALTQGAKGLDIIRGYFGFSASDLRWGMYDGWDGLGHAATDGFISWACPALCAYVRDLGGKELPTFGLCAVMTASIGDYVDTPNIDAAYVALASSRGLAVREPVAMEGFLYLTKSKTKSGAEHFSVIKAAVTTR